MKRRLLIIVIFLLLGAVVNVAVAWGCAILINPFGVEQETRFGYWRADEDPTSRWIAHRWTRTGSIHFQSQMGHRRWVSKPDDPNEIVPSWLNIATPTPEHKASRRPYELRRIDSRGWPAISMWSELKRISWGGILDEVIIPHQGGISTGLPDWDGPVYWAERILLLRPIWPGFPVNTLFYATLLWLLIPGPFALCRFLRLRRGLCPKCAYPMGESAVCSECGGALR